MAKIKSFCKNHIYAFTFFAFLVLYNFVVVLKCKLPVISGVVYSFHAVDYSMGFCSQILPGAIFNLIYKTLSENKVLIHETVLMLLFFLMVAFFCEKLFKKAPEEYRKTALTVILFFLSGPGTFAAFIRDIGSLDMYWVFSAAFFLLCLTKKQLYPLMIIPFVACVLVHYASFVCYIPFCVIIALYKISCLDDKKENKMLWISLSISLSVAFALAVYFIKFQQSNLTYTLDEFHAIFEKLGVEHTRYYNWAFYQTGESEIGDHLTLLENAFESTSFFETILLAMQLGLTLHNLYSLDLDCLIYQTIIILPVVVLFFAFIAKQTKTNKTNKLKAFALICSLCLFFAANLAGFLFSGDRVRWMVHAFIMLVTTVFYICYTEKQSLWGFAHRIIHKVPTLVMLLYFIIYAVNTYDLYS